MKNIYLDNAATTPIRQEVIDEMVKVMQSEYGNPSSTHSIGRSAKAIIETSRKTIAKQLHCNAQEIVFTSTATEATNWILRSAVKDFGVKRIITSKIEHHATLYTVQALQEEFGIAVEFVNVSHEGTLDYAQFLERNFLVYPTFNDQQLNWIHRVIGENVNVPLINSFSSHWVKHQVQLHHFSWQKQ